MDRDHTRLLSQTETLNYLESRPEISGNIKLDFADFVVQEDLGFSPSGFGNHIFVSVTKKGLTTIDVAKKISEVAGHKLSSIGYSGMKDKNGECTQWFSFPLTDNVEQILSSIEDANLSVVASKLNERKLKIGSHRRNFFDITIRNCAGGQDTFEDRLQAIREYGVPNYFGMQRFGHKMQNVIAFYESIISDESSVSTCKKANRYKVNSTTRGIQISAARAFLFNEVLSARLNMENWTTYLPGDVLNLDGTESYFLLEEDDQREKIQRRLDIFDIHISGPLAGIIKLKDKYVTRLKAADIELGSLNKYEELLIGLKNLNVMASRRPLRFRAENLQWFWINRNTLKVTFSLRKGCYATSLLREVCLFD